MSESIAERRRRKFAAGVLDQLAAGMSAYSAGVFTTGVVAPLVASLIGVTPASVVDLLPLTVSLGSAAGLLVAALLLKGRSKRMEDDASGDNTSASRSDMQYMKDTEPDHD